MFSLATDRLMLRVFNTSDAAFVLQLLNEPGWLRYIGDRNVRNEADAVDWIQTKPLAHQEKMGYSFYVVCLSGTGEAIGICGLVKRDALDHTDIGYAFLDRYHGQGYALEAARAVMRHARTDLQLPVLAAITLAENDTSNRLLTKLGFIRNGVVTLQEGEQENLLWHYDFPTDGAEL